MPAQRTLYMLCVVAAALWLGTRDVGVGGAGRGAPRRAAARSVGGAVGRASGSRSARSAAILFVMVESRRAAALARGWARTQAAVTLALMPLLLALFQQVSLISPVANAFAIPVVSLVVVPLALVGMLLPFDCVLHARALQLMACVHVRCSNG